MLSIVPTVVMYREESAGVTAHCRQRPHLELVICQAVRLDSTPTCSRREGYRCSTISALRHELEIDMVVSRVGQ